MGDVTLENFLNTHGLIPEELCEQKVLITRFSDVPYEYYMALADKLHNADITASIYLGTKKFGKQIDYAVKEHYSHVVILGASELEAKNVKIKNLATREEQEIPMEKLTEFFGK